MCIVFNAFAINSARSIHLMCDTQSDWLIKGRYAFTGKNKFEFQTRRFCFFNLQSEIGLLITVTAQITISVFVLFTQ